MKERLLGNKRNIVILIVILIALLVGFAFGISALISNADTDAKQQEQITVSKEEKKSLEKEKAKLEDNMEKELADAKTEEEKEAIKAKYKEQLAKVDDKITVAEENIETAKKDPVKPNKPDNPKPKPTPDKPSKPEVTPDKPKPKPDPKPNPDPKPSKPEKVWGIVKPAWDETVTKYRTEYVGKYVCESEIGTKYYDTNKEAYEYLVWCTDNGYLCNYYWDDYAIEEQVPYTEVIHHEAVYGWIEK